jgi:hypothetical protein
MLLYVMLLYAMFVILLLYSVIYYDVMLLLVMLYYFMLLLNVMFVMLLYIVILLCVVMLLYVICYVMLACRPMYTQHYSKISRGTLEDILRNPRVPGNPIGKHCFYRLHQWFSTDAPRPFAKLAARLRLEEWLHIITYHLFGE